MQLVTQSNVKTGSDRERAKRTKKDARAGTIAAIHITWKKLRPDLRHDKDELRESRLAFMSQVLKREVTSSRDLTLRKLGKVLDAMRELERAPLLPGALLAPERRSEAVAGLGEVVHLATEFQVVALNKIFDHLRWSLEAIEGFLFKRFKTKSHRMLTPDQANKLTMILLTIAASRDIKNRTKVERVSRAMVRAEIPALKRRLEIDQKPADDARPEDEDYQEEEWA